MNELALVPSREEFRELTERGNVIPIYTELIADSETPVSAFQKIDQGGYSFLFESAEQNEQSGRYSFVGAEPRVVLQSRGRTISVTEQGATRTFETTADPLAELEELMRRYHFVSRPELPRFAGGAVGFIGYDVVRFFEPTVPVSPNDELDLPEMVFLITSGLLIFDHRFRRLKVLVNAFVETGDDPDEAYNLAETKIRRLLHKLEVPVRLPFIDTLRKPAAVEPQSNTRRDEYERMVVESKEYIAAGDIFQTVLSQRFETAFTGDALDLYRCLRFVNPSPYMFCLKFAGQFSLVGSSPELHVRVVDELVEIRPIAGTRPRGRTPEEDQRNADDLLADPKECAEHVMLIDLARNDLGRIADFGTVEVTDRMIIERYSHVMHIVSHVIARLREGQSAYDVLRATFPAGTVSGAPKVRAMQVISQFEKAKRGCYAGAVGYFGFDGNLDSCIALRSVVLKNGKAYVQAGAGIVADSTPAGEYHETVNKAMAVMQAIARTQTI